MHSLDQCLEHGVRGVRGHRAVCHVARDNNRDVGTVTPRRHVMEVRPAPGTSPSRDLADLTPVLWMVNGHLGNPGVTVG